MTEQQKHVEKLIEMAANAKLSDDAVRFSQGALNAANAMRVLVDMARGASQETRK